MNVEFIAWPVMVLDSVLVQHLSVALLKDNSMVNTHGISKYRFWEVTLSDYFLWFFPSISILRGKKLVILVNIIDFISLET